MESEYLNERQYFNLIGGIAILHDCQLVDVDRSRQVVNFTGPSKKADACAAELKVLLRRSEY